MAHASFTMRMPEPARVGWRRSRRRRWARPNDLDAAASMLATMPSLPRAALVRLTAELIAGIDGHDDDHSDPVQPQEEHHD
jgi:hypothetical protein